MIEKLVRQKLTIAGKEYEYPDTTALIGKINELVDAVNKLETMAKNTNTVLESLVEENNIHEKQIDELQMKVEPEKCETRSENVRLPYMQNKRLRKALGIAQSALVKLANDAYDMDEHIYIDKILNQIERITKGGDNEL